MATNKAALKQLIHTAPTNYDFRKTNTLFKPVKVGTNVVKIKLPEQNFTYGKPLDYEDPIKNVLANTYGEDDKKFRHTMYSTMFSK